LAASTNQTDARRTQVSQLRITSYADRAAIGQAAAPLASAALRRACEVRGTATLVVATGSSQFEVLAALRAAPSIPWDRVTIFHLDEYVGLDAEHPASFRRFLHDRFVDRLPTAPAAFHAINGTAADPAAECARLAALVPASSFDVSLIGIGENAHLAFNDPPADFDCEEPYRVVVLDDRCRQQQVGEGWFPALADVPSHAISMSVRRILASRLIVCSVPDRRKAEAVQASIEGAITPAVPASILQSHPCCHLLLDHESASLLEQRGTSPT
jgi:glucosamine-6-phosphate deaminase